jgi:hypothetical protein
LTGVGAGALELLPQTGNAYFAIGQAGTTTALLHVKNTGTNIFGDVNCGNGVEGTPAYSFLVDTDTGMYRAAANVLGFSTGGTERMRITSDGNMMFGGSTGVQEKYFSGNSVGSTAFSHDITHTDDSSQGTILHIQASFTHHPSYDCVLDTWISRRGSAFSHSELFRRNTSLSGTWTVSYVSATVTRVTKSAGTYGGGGPYWIKATWKNN